MRLTLPRFSMPLLAKELTEQAARKRTYILRVVYALLLYGPALLFLNELLGSNRYSPTGVLGHGREMFYFIYIAQLCGVYLFLPAMTAGLISREKERDALSLLLLTDMRPWEILLQKLLGRLMAMLSFLLLSMPLMAVAYAYGGVQTRELTLAIVALLLTMLQVGSLCLTTSTYCRSTVTAFISAYLIGMAMYAIPAGMAWSLYYLIFRPGPSIESFWLLGLIPALGMQFATQSSSFVAPAVIAIPSLVSSLFFLVMARVFLIRRASIPPRNMLLNVFKWLDEQYRRANVVTGGVVLFKNLNRVPGDHPIAWREVYKRSLGQPQHLIRVLILALIPSILVTSEMLVYGHRREGEAGLTATILFLWPLIALMLTVQAANTFASERTRQTLDVLLATPITGRQIVQEKMAGVWRMCAVMLIALLVPIAIKTWWNAGIEMDANYGWDSYNRYVSGSEWWSDYVNMVYLTRALLIIATLFPFLAWQAAWIGLKVRRPIQAVMFSLAAVAVWCIAPLVVAALIAMTMRNSDLSEYLVPFCPAAWLGFNEMNEFRNLSIPPWLTVAFDMVLFGGIAVFFRARCLARADLYLGRVPEPRPAASLR